MISNVFYRQHERELGFVVVVDRRNDKWNSLRILLTRVAVCLFSVIYISFAYCVIIDFWLFFAVKCSNVAPESREVISLPVSVHQHDHLHWLLGL